MKPDPRMAVHKSGGSGCVSSPMQMWSTKCFFGHLRSDVWSCGGRALEIWGNTDIVLHADHEPSTCRAAAAVQEHRTLSRHGLPHLHQSQGPVEACIGVYRGTCGANKPHLLQEACLSWLVRHVVWLMTRYNAGADGMSRYRRLCGKPYSGSICMFGELTCGKLQGRPSCRAESGWEFGTWLGKAGTD